MKDKSGACCFHVDSEVGRCEVNFRKAFETGKPIEGFQSLTFAGHPAGKIYLTITPLSK